ncbi:DEAD/DEAH box helicase family protein [Salegentibacter sp. F188]|uniref:DEAD/DEAH box helicase family protein n=1 Tax=Autumnicola patrickiae TaxID=3075591 RepID=A0ABU3DZ48_9FLAO|nr:DEAD/DEAH box helicase family protein [Salegentibacter sp. F188]MDT0688739.1 DEAD/DEAH box helicase family protein [Salegentibacter sp. F188]
MEYYRNIKFPTTFEYSSDSEDSHIPFEFYSEVFPRSKRIDLFLGYFNSFTFSLLSESFAEFIYKGGEIRIVTNHFYSATDYDNLVEEPDEYKDYSKAEEIVGNLKKLQKTLDARGQLFFDCLKFLKKQGRLRLQPVLFGKQSMNHHKKMLFFDGRETILTQGSMNFTPAGVAKNGESFQVEVPWNGGVSKSRISKQVEHFDKVFSKKHTSYKYLNITQLERVIDDIGNEKDLKDLLFDAIECSTNEEYSQKIRTLKTKQAQKFQLMINKIESEPRFPFPQGPREYQKKAFENWKKNNSTGIFAMATGTGKTVTALNCILEGYRRTGKYKFIVLVPTRALVEQWEKEIKVKFNFQEIISVRSKYFYQEIEYDEPDENSCILLTYATFKGQKFQEAFKRFSHKDSLTLIADEAHNMGSKGFLRIIDSLEPVKKRIGLSATPSRYFDDYGEQQVYTFFNIKIEDNNPDFTYSFSISEAINAKPEPFLCPYTYRIKFVELEKDELNEYKEYTRQLARHIDGKGKLMMSIEVEKILKLRKDIIKKARNKKFALLEIIDEIGPKNFKYSFVYVPEGKEIDYSENDLDWDNLDQQDLNIISDYTLTVNERYKNEIPIRHFTGQTRDRQSILKDFETGKTDSLFAMKCLDEGVDIPRTEIAIFCSSTGNPRQYVQRRGRVLRLHKEKENALIYDMIVIPVIDFTSKEREFNCEKGLIEGEVRRLIEFALDSQNLDEILSDRKLLSIADHYGINLNDYLK